MKRVRNYFILIMIIISTFCLFIAYKTRSLNTVFADDSYLSVEQYTESDNLLKEDGTESLKAIQKFAEEVQAGQYNACYPELAEVIPRQYLESQEKKATFAYNGKEYGFYVSKNDDVFNVLLIDFIYKFYNNKSDLEHKIKISPILQQNFVRTTDDSGAYTWKKTTSAATYYVGNPRFLSEIKNENANCPAGRFLPTGQLLYSVNQRLSECSILNFGTQFGSTASIRVVTKSRICFSVYFSS